MGSLFSFNIDRATLAEIARATDAVNRLIDRGVGFNTECGSLLQDVSNNWTHSLTVVNEIRRDGVTSPKDVERVTRVFQQFREISAQVFADAQALTAQIGRERRDIHADVSSRCPVHLCTCKSFGQLRISGGSLTLNPTSMSS